MVKLTKNPITWIIFAIACIVGVVLWVFKVKDDED